MKPIIIFRIFQKIQNKKEAVKFIRAIRYNNEKLIDYFINKYLIS